MGVEEKKMFYLLTLLVFYFSFLFSLLMGESVWWLCSPIDRCRLSALLDLSAPQTNGLMMGLDPTLLLAQPLSSRKGTAQVVQYYPPHEPVNDKREKWTRFSSYRVAVFFFLCAQYNTSIEK
jgi:hypothetical protein